MDVNTLALREQRRSKNGENDKENEDPVDRIEALDFGRGSDSNRRNGRPDESNTSCKRF